MSAPRLSRRLGIPSRAFLSDERGASAVEFAIVSMPFILMLLAIAQLAIYFMTQASLDAGVVKTADSLVNSYYSGAVPTTPTATALQSQIVAASGGLISQGANLSVDLRLLSAMGSGVVPINNTVDANSPGSVLALRAQATVISVVPGLSTLYVRSSALVRRQNS